MYRYKSCYDWFKSYWLVWLVWLRFNHFKTATLDKLFEKMASNVCNLGTDIGKERYLTHRQKMIGDILLNCYAEEITSTITSMVLKNCNGCLIDHPSQRQHDCLMMEADERLWLYFQAALESVSEAEVVEKFMNSLKDIKPKVNGLELLKYTCKDWRMLFCGKQKQLLKKKTLDLL